MERAQRGPALPARLLCALLLMLPACRSTPAPPPRDTLTVLLTGDILTLDPNQEVQVVTDSVLFNVYEPLVGFDENLQVRTILAESWEHPSPERWRFQLRRGVRFHDGTPFDAETVREVLTTLQKSPGHDAASFAGEVQQVVVTGSHTVEFVTAQPRAILTSLPFLYMAKPNTRGAFPPQVGTGPYSVREWTPKRQVVLDRNPSYWGPAPTFRQVTFQPVLDAAERLQAVAGGRADIAYQVQPDATRQPPSGVGIVRRPGLTVFYVGFNLRERPGGNPFRDLRVRQAFHLAVDRGRILEQALLGTGTVPTQPIAPFVFGYNPQLAPPRTDVARARALLAEAGQPSITTRIDVPRHRRRVAELIRDQLAQVGVTLQVEAHDTDEVYRRAEAGTTELFFAGWDCSSGESSEFYEFCLHTPGGRYGAGNYGAYSNKALDEIAETNANVLDPRKRRALLEKAAAMVMDDLPVLPLFVEDNIYAVREGVKFVPRADSEIRLADVTLASAR